MGVPMRYGKGVAIVLFMILVLIVIANSFYVTPFTISDTDPSTYVIVPILMLPLFSFFLIKEHLEPDVHKKDIILGLVLFLIFLITTVYLRIQFSYLFISYRIDILILPLVIASFAILLFGTKNIKVFRWLIVYTILASPLLMLPIINLNQSFTALNSIFVYSLVKPFVPGASYFPPTTITANGYPLGIGERCVGIGVLISLVLFLLPVAYLYNGKRAKKTLWIVSGILLLLIFNIIRMTLIAVLWFDYGQSSGLAVFHLFAGILLFYISIIIMVLVTGFYGLNLMIEKKKVRKGSSIAGKNLYFKIGIILAFIIAISYFALSFNYYTAFYASPVQIGNVQKINFNNTVIKNFIGIVANNTRGALISTITTANVSSIEISNKTFNASNPIVISITYQNQATLNRLLSLNKVIGHITFLSSKGLTENVYDLISNNTEFLAYNTGIPYFYGNGSSTVLGIYGIFPGSQISKVSCRDNYDSFYTYAFNLLNKDIYNASTAQKIETASCIVKRLVNI